MSGVPSLSPQEFAAALQGLGLGSDRAAARTLGCTPRAIRHWRGGDRRVQGPVVVLLQVLLALG